MTIDQYLDTFGGLPIRPAARYTGGDPAGVAWKVDVLSGPDESIAEQLETLVTAANPRTDRIEGLVIGAFTEDHGDGSSTATDPLLALSGRLSGLRVLFLGDMTYEDCEISWIQHNADHGALANRFPRLEWLGIRGANGLRLTGMASDSLVGLVLESGGLPAELATDLISGRFPNLRHLELWIGTDEYGRSTDATTLAPLFAGDRFPALRTLGLRNAENTDVLVGALVRSPLFARLGVLDLSMGTLSDDGGRALLASPHLDRLEGLRIAHHYLSDEVVDALAKRLGDKLHGADEPGDDEPYVEVGE